MYVPQYIKGRRVFTWQPGKMTQAVAAGKWLLLDELNLAPAEVLDRIASHLESLQSARSSNSTSTSGDPAIHVFATMNPASIGGGRTALPRSIRNMFMTVQLQASVSMNLLDSQFLPYANLLSTTMHAHVATL